MCGLGLLCYWFEGVRRKHNDDTNISFSMKNRISESVYTGMPEQKNTWSVTHITQNGDARNTCTEINQCSFTDTCREKLSQHGDARSTCIKIVSTRGCPKYMYKNCLNTEMPEVHVQKLSQHGDARSTCTKMQCTFTDTTHIRFTDTTHMWIHISHTFIGKVVFICL